jgi:aminoglycoside 3-N-acetyltransferase
MIEVMYSRRELADAFRALGLAPGDSVMAHASVRSVGEIAGGPDQIHLAIKDAITAEGTLMMYASCPSYYDEVGRGNLTADQEREVLEKLPVFDARTARAQRDNGTLVEFFRTYPDALVNDHVARFVVWGHHARHVISTQPWDYAFGRGSALERFMLLGGRILLIGADHDTVTFLHYTEHVVDIPDKRVSRFQVPIDINNARVWRAMEEFDTSGGAHANWPDRFFARIVDTHLAQTNNRGGRVGNACCYLIDAQELHTFAETVMKAVAEKASAADRLLVR